MTPTLADLDWPLRTEHLVLRPGRVEDAEAVWPWYRLPEVQEWTTTLSPTLDDHRQRWARGLEDCVVGLCGDRVVAAGKVARGTAWSQADMAAQARGRQAELGWVLDPGVQGRGLGTEFAAALRDLAFDGLGVRRVEAQCFADNVASRRVMEKIGLRLEGVFVEESLHRSGRWLDGMSWALLEREHRARRG
ncbi:GNAT family N-acetyltransferase [Brachybacterium sacelli]|uniref:RimJ/RimL family protein N-acetyltransferase n=1 Tax=Brachybacterium sacelli TaxID=173364 RepID=A0ABS4X694_9MICO|nr:GNAT family protein [Brachybacterium sacelli]MBP2383950.1 RimJ/RimL family protein N-acetyltransferase [Brachybacterium sacelli]